MEDIRKIVIFGGTGMTGQCAVDAALELGVEVTVLVRDAQRLGSGAVGRVTVIEGDVLDEAAVTSAVQGQDAVVYILGTRNDLSPTTMLSDGLRNVLSAMSAQGVSKVAACMSAFLFWDEDKIPPRFNDIHADHKRMLAQLQECDRQWVGVLPPHITEGPALGDYTVARGSGPGRNITKQDLAHFLVTCLGNNDNFGQLCGLCDKN